MPLQSDRVESTMAITVRHMFPRTRLGERALVFFIAEEEIDLHVEDRTK